MTPKEVTRAKLQFFDRLVRDPRPGGADIRTAWRLIDRYNHKEGFARPSIVGLADELFLNEKTVRRSVARLEGFGWFKVVRHRGRRIWHYIPVWENRTPAPAFEAKKKRTGGPGFPTKYRTAQSQKPDSAIPENRTATPTEPLTEPLKTLEEPTGAARAALPNGRAGVASVWNRVKERVAASQVLGAEWLDCLEPLPNSEPGTMVLRAPAALIRDQAKEKLREPLLEAYAAEGWSLQELKFVMPGQVP